MKKLFFIVGGIIIVAVLGRFGWAYYQVKSDESRVADATVSVVTAPESAKMETTTPNTPLVSTSSVLQGQTKVAMSSQILDCKGDIPCFLKAMDNKCTLAKLNSTIYGSAPLFVNPIDLQIVYKKYFEIKGSSGVGCTIYEKSLGSSSAKYDAIKWSQQDKETKDALQPIIDAINQAPSSVGKNWLCHGTSKEFKRHIDDLVGSTISDKYPYSSTCIAGNL